MPKRASPTGSEFFIVDNSDTDWKAARYLHDWCQISKAIDVATAYFEIGSLLALDGEWQKVDKIRILMGAEVSLRSLAVFKEALASRKREDAIRAFARWMDFRRTGPSIDEVSRSLINGLIKGGRLESDGPSIRRT